MRFFLFLIICVSLCWSDETSESDSVELKSKLKFSPFLIRRTFPSVKRDKKRHKESAKVAEKGLKTASDRIFGGGVAPRNAYPYQAGLAIKRGSKSSWCGGSLISNQFVITAAHCVEKATSANVILGAHERSDSKEKGRVEITVKKKNIIIHEKWSRGKLTNDIAILKLGSIIQFTDEIKPVSLPPNDDEDLEGETGIISGWGHFDKNKKLSRYLRYTQSEILPNKECQKYYSSHVKSTNICLDGSKGNATCNGDSGGPLVVIWEETKPTLVGLTSFGSSRGCSKGMPTVFTKLSKYLSWIKSKTGI